MLALGLVLLVIGVLVLLAGIFTAGDAGTASLVGVHLGATAVFLLGVFSAAAILLGLWCAKLGTKRSIKHARDQRRQAAKDRRSNGHIVVAQGQIPVV